MINFKDYTYTYAVQYWDNIFRIFGFFLQRQIYFQVRYAGKQSSRLSSGKDVGQAPAGADPVAAAALEKKVAEQGNIVRDLKAAKGDKDAISAAVALLLDLKKQLAVAQGVDPAAQDTKKGKGKQSKAQAPAKGSSPASAAVAATPPALTSSAAADIEKQERQN